MTLRVGDARSRALDLAAELNALEAAEPEEEQ
jgi:hypothetical protein